MTKLLLIIIGLKGQIRRVTRLIRGSLKDPLLYLGSFSVILFILAVSLPCLCSNISLGLVISAKTSPDPQSLFLGPPMNFWPESPDFLLVQGSGLRGISSPSDLTPKVLGALVGYETEVEASNEITEYIVEEGDNLSSIADKFGISLNTLLWANNLTKGSVLKVGQELIILPVSGVLHHVKSGDTIGAIALKYKANTEEIVAFNKLSGEADIYVGDIIIIPDGVMPPPPVQQQYAPQSVQIAESYFICPISAPCRITQGLHFYNAIDFSHGQCGEPIFAAAGGQVLKVKFGWNGGAGNTISILHPNGVVTSYGHIASSLVNPGEQVSQGQIIAFMGGQPGTSGSGKSTGCHVHFGVSGARNPFAR